MADISHLELMGRELKCPICLSLLKSAVSLSCNHFFCNLCIEKSMKASSDCPVCKLPYRRREIRPAAHIDNLVGIYRRMEVASGVNIFLTQNAPQSKLSDEGKKSEDDLKCNVQESNGTHLKETQNRISCEGKRPEIDHGTSSIGNPKPSFPTKKRVQVPRRPSTEASAQPGISESVPGMITGDEYKNGSASLNEKPTLNEKGEVALSPFFWLKDDNDTQKTSQQIEHAHLDTSPQKVLSFSDMRDSDDETPKDKANGKPNIADFDSEMFEWTQRPCSPELCSSPTTMQAANADGFDGDQNNNIKDDPKCGNTNEELIENTNTSYVAKKDYKKCRPTKYNRHGRKASNQPKRKGIKSDIGDGPANHPDPKKLATSREQMSKNIPSISVWLGPLNQENENILDDIPDAPVKLRMAPNFSLNNCGRTSKQNRAHNLSEHIENSKKQRAGSVKGRKSEEPDNENQVQGLVPQSASGGKLRKFARKFDTMNKLKCNREQRCLKKLKVNLDVSSNNTLISATQDHQSNVCAEGKQSGKGSLDTEAADKLSRGGNDIPITDEVMLHRNDNPAKFYCAFCQSAAESEASGKMAHYFNGKPVAADYNGGYNVVHSHRNCTEWAPNVYFENDIAINLDAELSRSRRIKCNLCGMKGAALGCYDKTCRKSFHVPCAKLTPQCRWDAENFVMLCPIHISSELPSECFGSQRRKRMKCASREQSHTQQAQIPPKHETRPSWLWKSHGSPAKVVLCCSALSEDEKEVVSEFKRITGVIELKKWSSNVTHVIASTDKNGACRRTLKVLMGILEGKWIVNIDWTKACLKDMKPVYEEPYEISVDTHGIRDGPRCGRLRCIDKQPKLFHGFKFYFTGDFTPKYKGYLQDLVIAAGGVVLLRKPVSIDQEAPFPGSSTTSQTYVIYSVELPENGNSDENLVINRRRFEAEALASSVGVKVTSNSWILNSIAACKLQNHDSFY